MGGRHASRRSLRALLPVVYVSPVRIADGRECLEQLLEEFGALAQVFVWVSKETEPFPRFHDLLLRASRFQAHRLVVTPGFHLALLGWLATW